MAYTTSTKTVKSLCIYNYTMIFKTPIQRFYFKVLIAILPPDYFPGKYNQPKDELKIQLA